MTDTLSVAQHQATFAEAMNGYFGGLGGTVGVMVHDLGTGLELTYNHTERFPTASTLKAPLLYALFRQSDEGTIDLAERVTLHHATRTPGSGILQDLDEGLQPTIRDLAELMIIVSDNWATDLLFERVGKKALADVLTDLGMKDTFIPMNIREMFCALADVDPADTAIDYASLKDILKTYRANPENLVYSSDELNDVSTPEDMVRFSLAVHAGAGVSEAAREGILKILKDQNFNTRIPARLPQDAGIEVAHKTGSLRGIVNDIGIVYSPTINYAVAFMSKGQEDTAETVDQMARASRWIWDYLKERVGEDSPDEDGAR
jgi:beta-lactamase class A